MTRQAVQFRVQKPLKHLSWGFCSPMHTAIAIDMSTRCASSLNQPSARKSESSSTLFSNYKHMTKCFSMSAGVSLCSIWILHGYSWKSFFKILCNDTRKRLNSWERLRRDFFELLPTESLTSSTLSGHLAIYFLSDQRFSDFLLRLFTDPVAWNLCIQR